ncbi:hypothetical protein SynMVIR181_01129 [Synechococcus sp. MVIR-18-1]|nr:hypothetical protein SynMVIR181_01129 [Synechococcus sp. MVIR-18-1]
MDFLNGWLKEKSSDVELLQPKSCKLSRAPQNDRRNNQLTQVA